MKKFMMIGLIVILLAFSAVPVLAAKPNNHGRGNGVGAGQGSNGGDRNQNRVQDTTQSRTNLQGNGLGVNGERGKNNHTSMRMRTPFYLQGTIESIVDSQAMTITVEVVHGNAQVKSFIGNTITLTLSSDTQIFKITQGGDNEGTEASAPSTNTSDEETPGNRVPIEFSGPNGLAVGDVVAIHGNVVTTTQNGVDTHTYNATLVTVYVKTGTG